MRVYYDEEGFMKHYLTKWEFYILFVELMRFQSISFSQEVYTFHIHRNLSTLRGLPFFCLSPQLSKEVLDKISRSKSFHGTPLEHNSVINIYFHDRKCFSDWLDWYLNAYRNDELHSRRELFCSSENSMKRTMQLLRKYQQINSKKALLKAEIDDGDGGFIKTNTKSRLYEDILILAQEGKISIDDVFLDNSAVLREYMGEESDNPSFSLRISFLQHLEPEEEQVFQMPDSAHKPFLSPVHISVPVSVAVSVPTAKPTRMPTLEPAVEQEKEKKSFLDIFIDENQDVYFKGKKLAFSSSAKAQIGLLKLLVSQKGKMVTRAAVYKELGYTSKSRKRNKYCDIMDDENKRGPKSNIQQRYRERLKNLIKQIIGKFPAGSIEIVNTDKDGVFIKPGKTEVSQQ